MVEWVVCVAGRKESDYEVKRLATYGKYPLSQGLFVLQCFDTAGWASGRASGLQQGIRGRRDDMPPADGSSAVAKIAAVRSPHISGSQRAYSRAYSKEFFGVHNFKSSCMM